MGEDAVSSENWVTITTSIKYLAFHSADSLDPDAGPAPIQRQSSLAQPARLTVQANVADNSVRVKDGSGITCTHKLKHSNAATNFHFSVTGCRFPGINYLGGDLSPQEGGYGIETSDPDHCRRECAKRQKCSFWSHIKHWKVNCYLKEKKGPDRNFDGATSGSLFIPCGRSKKSV